MIFFLFADSSMEGPPSPVPLRSKANMFVEEYEAAREDAFTFFSVDDMSMAHIERILNAPRQFVKRYIIIIKWR